MYSYEDRLKAVKLFIKFDLSIADTISELGYPSRNMLKHWYKEYVQTGGLHKLHGKKPRYSLAQKKHAVDYYMQHGRNMARTIKAIGYPHRETMREWLYELCPNERKVYSKHSSMVEYTPEQRKAAVVGFCTGSNSAVAVANALGVSRTSLYKWKKELLGEGCVQRMKHRDKLLLPDDKDTLLAEVELLKKQVYNLQMEYDILEKAAEIVKKDQGINPRELANAEKARAIDALRKAYPLNELLNKLGISKSSYFYQRKTQNMSDKYIDLRTKVKEIFADNQAR